jgi:hypothetical protein
MMSEFHGLGSLYTSEIRRAGWAESGRAFGHADQGYDREMPGMATNRFNALGDLLDPQGDRGGARGY